MGIVHSWFQSWWNWVAICVLFAGLLLVNLGGVFQYIGGGGVLLALIVFWQCSEREDRSKI